MTNIIIIESYRYSLFAFLQSPFLSFSFLFFFNHFKHFVLHLFCELIPLVESSFYSSSWCFLKDSYSFYIIPAHLTVIFIVVVILLESVSVFVIYTLLASIREWENSVAMVITILKLALVSCSTYTLQCCKTFRLIIFKLAPVPARLQLFFYYSMPSILMELSCIFLGLVTVCLYSNSM